MPAGFPPRSSFPSGLDTDYSLFQVYNTTQSIIPVDNQPWSDEIEILPVPFGNEEVWATNGFATIAGELFYYDTVGTTDDGRINLLKRCARNLGGEPTQYNLVGASIFAFVVAEHHNQLAQCIMDIENFVGIDFDTRIPTLDYRIRHLEAIPVIWDDFTCPDVTLFFDVVSSDPVTGTVVQYNVQVDGSYDSFQIDFGDGTSSTSALSGTHTYAPNATIDPVVTCGNDQCTITQTDIERSTPTLPVTQSTQPPFTIGIPELPVPPPLIFPALGPIAPVLDFPPIVFPCIDITPFPGISINIGPIDIQIPSVISFTPINIPSFISITPINIPSFISITPINIPSIINFGPGPTFSPIGFSPAPMISPIGFAPIPSIAPIDIDITVTIDGSGIPSCISIGSGPNCGPPSIAINWGSPPTLNVAFVHQLNSQQAKKYSKEDLELMRELGDDYRDFFPDLDDSLQVEYSGVGIPSEISILPPKFPDIQLRHSLPQEIQITKADFHLPDTIQILAPKTSIPTEIQLINNNIPSFIELISDIPSIIKLEHDIPNRIFVESLANIPDIIRIEHNIPEQIRVVGIPDTIELVFPQETIKLTIDENLEVPLVFRGPPIELKIDMPKFFVTDDDDDYPRVKIVPAPCPKR